MIYLPEMTDKIKDTIEGLKGNWQDYETHKAATPESENVHGLQDMIQTLTALFGAEYGKNANGDWIRFNFGLQICWHRVPVTELCNVAAGALYRTNSMTWTFPKPFVGSTARAFFEANSLNRWAHGATVATNDSVWFRVMRPDTSTYLGSVEALAIGWWKTPDDPAEWSEE